MKLKEMLSFVKRNAKELRVLGISGPFFTANKTVAFTDSYAVMEVPVAWAPGNWMTYNTKLSGLYQFFDEAKKVERVSFRATVKDLSEWLVANTDACPICMGVSSLCVVPLFRDEMSPEEEDGESVHYGWIGPVALDRRRLMELLFMLEPDPEEGVEILGAVDYGPPRAQGGNGPLMRQTGVRVTAKQWTICLAGRSDRREAAPKFHLEGKFASPKFKKARKT